MQVKGRAVKGEPAGRGNVYEARSRLSGEREDFGVKALGSSIR